ncbi:MAG TPA: hypothetical protein VGF45_07460 [Polyangia bacterium]
MGCDGSSNPPNPDGGQNDAAVDAVKVTRTCWAPPGVSTNPVSISEVVALINSLPMPVTVPCFLETLDRPLTAMASRGVISLQPAFGSRSPRIFLLSPQLVMTVVPEGKSGTVIEFGQYTAPGRTLKAEIAFPVEAPLTAAAPYDRVRSTTTGTTCRSCHRDEEALVIDGVEGFVSAALAPVFREVIDLVDVQAERRACDAKVEPFRCAVLGALFDHGEVREGRFPPEVGTITR